MSRTNPSQGRAGVIDGIESSCDSFKIKRDFKILSDAAYPSQ